MTVKIGMRAITTPMREDSAYCSEMAKEVGDQRRCAGGEEHDQRQAEVATHPFLADHVAGPADGRDQHKQDAEGIGADPYEQKDLARSAQQSNLAAALRRRLEEWNRITPWLNS